MRFGVSAVAAVAVVCHLLLWKDFYHQRYQELYLNPIASQVFFLALSL
jgi:hypothetical protein